MIETLQAAIAAIKSGEKTHGKALLAEVLLNDPNNETAWLWMSGAVDEPEERRYCLEKLLSINPNNAAAQAGLARLGIHPPPPSDPLAAPFDEPFPSQSSPLPFTPPFTWDEEPMGGGTTIDDLFAGIEKPIESSKLEDAGAAGSQEIFPWETAPEDGSDELAKMFTTPDQPSQPAGEAGETSELDWLLHPEEESAPAQEEPLYSDYSDSLSSLRTSTDATSNGEEEAPLPSRPLTDLTFDEFGQRVSRAGEEYVEVPAAAPQYISTAPQTVWSNPQGSTSRLVILSERSIIIGNPEPDEIPQLVEMAATGEVQRNLLGHGARSIRLEHITQLHAPKETGELTITYLRGKDPYTQRALFTDPATRDEAYQALKASLGSDYYETAAAPNRLKSLIPPIVTLLALAFFTAVFAVGAYLLRTALVYQVSGGIMETLLNLFAFTLGPLGIAAIGGIFILAAIVWLGFSLRPPSPAITLIKKQR